MSDSHQFAPRRAQAIASLGFLALLVLTCVGIDALARDPSVDHWLMAKSSELSERNRMVFSDTGSFIDSEERVLLDEVPHADYAHGGVYFFGTSNMKWAFTTWDLPTAQRKVIGNYGIGASNHTAVLQWIRYLIKYRGFLSAGDKDLVIIGASFHLGSETGANAFFTALLHRRDLFTISPDGQIVPVPMNAVEHSLIVEKARSGGFILNVAKVAMNWLKASKGQTPPLLHNAEQYRDGWREFMGQNWRENMNTEIERLRETIELVRSHHAELKVVLLPQGTWMQQLPFESYYDTKVRTLCQETSTPLIDLHRSLPDDDFVDSNHLTVDGQIKFRTIIMREVEDQ